MKDKMNESFKYYFFAYMLVDMKRKEYKGVQEIQIEWSQDTRYINKRNLR